MSGHVAWVCGFLTAFGLASPFARAADFEKIARAAEVTARINMQNEIRVQVRIYCGNDDDDIRRTALRRIDELREELRSISKIEIPEPQCLRGGPEP